MMHVGHRVPAAAVWHAAPSERGTRRPLEGAQQRVVDGRRDTRDGLGHRGVGPNTGAQLRKALGGGGAERGVLRRAWQQRVGAEQRVNRGAA